MVGGIQKCFTSDIGFTFGLCGAVCPQSYVVKVEPVCLQDLRFVVCREPEYLSSDTAAYLRYCCKGIGIECAQILLTQVQSVCIVDQIDRIIDNQNAVIIAADLLEVMLFLLECATFVTVLKDRYR